MKEVIPAGAYGKAWALDLPPAVPGDWAAEMEAVPPSVYKVFKE